MMKKYRILMVFFTLTVILWVLAYVRINCIYKQATPNCYTLGQKCMYYGLEITPIEYTIYKGADFEKLYNVDIFDAKSEYQYVIVTTIHVKNLSGKYVDLKGGLYTWNIEVGLCGNGQELYLNTNEPNPYEKDSDIVYNMYFTMGYYGTIDELEKEKVRVYMGYYPELRFLEFN